MGSADPLPQEFKKATDRVAESLIAMGEMKSEGQKEVHFCHVSQIG